MCDPVIGMTLMAGGKMMEQSGQKAQANAQYAYGMQSADVQRKWNAQFQEANKKATMKAFYNTLSQLQNKGMQEAEFISRKTNMRVAELDKITSTENLSASESNVISSIQDNIRKRGDLEVDNTQAVATSRDNIEAQMNESQSLALSRLISGVPQPVIDPIKPDSSWGLGDVLGIASAGASGYSMFA